METGKDLEKEDFTICGGTLIEYSGPGGSVTVPPVETIGTRAFADLDKLTEVILPEGVMVILREAFYNCHSWARIQLPSTIRIIQERAFAGCHHLTVAMPRGLPTPGPDGIGFWAKDCFQDAIGFRLEVFDDFPVSPASLTCLWDDEQDAWLFNKHWITVRDSRTGEEKFSVYMGRGNGKVSSRYWKVAVDCWGEGASFDFPRLDNAFTLLRRTDDKITIATHRLQNPIQLSEKAKTVYRKYLKTKDWLLMRECLYQKDLEKMRLYTELGAFDRNFLGDELAKKNLNPEMRALLLELQQLAPGELPQTEELFSLELPKERKTNLPEWQADPENPELLRRYGENDSTVILPTELNGVRMTGVANRRGKTPGNYRAITSLTVPEGYTAIGRYAFSGCESLTEVALPDGLTRLEKGCFAGCLALKKVNIPATVCFIGESAFSGTSVTELEILGKVELEKNSLSNVKVLIVRGEIFVNEEEAGKYIAIAEETIPYVYSDGDARCGTYFTNIAQAMPLSYVALRPGELMRTAPRNCLRGKYIWALDDLTGLPNHSWVKERPTLDTFVRALGGYLTTTPGKNTNLVLIRDLDPASVEKAFTLAPQARIMTEKTFLEAIRFGRLL